MEKIDCIQTIRVDVSLYTKLLLCNAYKRIYITFY